MKCNSGIRCALKEHGFMQWELAEMLNISEGALCRKLRRELVRSEQDYIISVIKRNAELKVKREGKHDEA